jgi:hypothetical protein
MKATLGCGALALILFGAILATGQDADPPPMPMPAPAGAAEDGPEGRQCDVYVSSGNPSDQAVVGTDGTYLRRVRAVALATEIASKSVTATLESWDGPYRPTPNLVEKAVWQVRKVRVVTPAELRLIIDGGQAPAAAETPPVVPPAAARPK